MRIAHIITRMIVGGAQENTLFTCQDLIQLYKDDVLLITGPAIGPEGDLLGQGRGGEVPVRLIPELLRPIHPVRDLRAYQALRQVLKEYRPEVVHTHSAKGGMLGRMAAWDLHVPAVLHTVHGAPFYPYQRAVVRMLFTWCERYAARRCHRLISVADAMTDLMVGAKVAPADKFVTVYSGMDVEPFLKANDTRAEVRKKFGYEPEHVVIGKVARLFHLKGHEYLITAAERIVRECPQVRFLLVGDGVLRESLTDRIVAAGLRDHFQFTGLVPPDEIPSLIGAMDVLVHCSLREGLARALPQALIGGKPVVSYDIDGAREVVIPGETGFLLPPKSIEPLEDAILKLAKDPELRQTFGERGRARFTDTFRHETMTRRLREQYEQVLNENLAVPAHA